MQVAERIRLAREQKALTQEEFSKRFGCNNRQTISAIETGIRRVSPEEIKLIGKILECPTSFFIDPYVITEKRAFSYRAKPNSRDIDAFEQQAHKLISANRRFCRLLGEPAIPFSSQLKSINKQSPLQAAAHAGDQASQVLDLGELPALKLRNAVEDKLHIMVLFLDGPESISGAACHLSDGDYILINRQEASFRRNFNLGHELFHLLTWNTMAPERIDEIRQDAQRPKVEKLADNFSSGLLLPSEKVLTRWKYRTPTLDIHEWIISTAKEFRVSGEAFYWRLVNLQLISTTEEVNRIRLSRSDEEDSSGKPHRFNAQFARRLKAVLDRGLVSIRKASDLLECDLDEVKEIVSSYGLEASF